MSQISNITILQRDTVPSIDDFKDTVSEVLHNIPGTDDISKEAKRTTVAQKLTEQIDLSSIDYIEEDLPNALKAITSIGAGNQPVLDTPENKERQQSYAKKLTEALIQKLQAQPFDDYYRQKCEYLIHLTVATELFPKADFDSLAGHITSFAPPPLLSSKDAIRMEVSETKPPIADFCGGLYVLGYGLQHAAKTAGLIKYALQNKDNVELLRYMLSGTNIAMGNNLSIDSNLAIEDNVRDVQNYLLEAAPTEKAKHVKQVIKYLFPDTYPIGRMNILERRRRNKKLSSDRLEP